HGTEAPGADDRPPRVAGRLSQGVETGYGAVRFAPGAAGPAGGDGRIAEEGAAAGARPDGAARPRIVARLARAGETAHGIVDRRLSGELPGEAGAGADFPRTAAVMNVAKAGRFG